jgi:hypothetical protein
MIDSKPPGFVPAVPRHRMPPRSSFSRLALSVPQRGP